MDIHHLIHTNEAPLVVDENTRKRKRENSLDDSDTADSESIISRQSARSSVSSLNDTSPSPIGLVPPTAFPSSSSLKPITSCNTPVVDFKSLFEVLAKNCSSPIELSRVKFTDTTLPKENDEFGGDLTSLRKAVIKEIHDKYVEPLLELTGYRWTRREVPSKGRGLKVFSIKYSCSQEVRRGQEDASDSSGRGRQLTHPLKQYTCDSSYSIKYTWSSQLVEINYKHMCHPPYRRLPDKLKPFILERLDMKALDLYQQILETPQFADIKKLILFSKVQSFWSKERSRKKDETTKDAFKKFLNK